MGRCPRCKWEGETRPFHYVDEDGKKAELGIYCPTRFIPDKNGCVEGVNDD